MKKIALLVALVSAVAVAVPVATQPPPPRTPFQAYRAATPFQRLRMDIERTTRGIHATWAVYIKCLETGDEIAINADNQMESMSTIKIPLMIEVLQQVKAGRLKLSDRYTYDPADVRGGTGVIRMLDGGATLTVKDLVTLMVVVSDNTATDVLYRLVGGTEPVRRRMNDLGLTLTYPRSDAATWFKALEAAPSPEGFYRDGRHPFGLSTAREMGRLLEMMERGTLVDKSSSDVMLEIMRGQVYRSRLPRYLSGFRVPHKTGDFLPFVGNDVGVLEFPGRTVVVSVFTGAHFGSGEALENAIGVVAKSVADYYAYQPAN